VQTEQRALRSNLKRALKRFDKLSEDELAEIARQMIRGAIEIERKGKTRDLQEA